MSLACAAGLVAAPRFHPPGSSSSSSSSVLSRGSSTGAARHAFKVRQPRRGAVVILANVSDGVSSERAKSKPGPPAAVAKRANADRRGKGDGKKAGRVKGGAGSSAAAAPAKRRNANKKKASEPNATAAVAADSSSPPPRGTGAGVAKFMGTIDLDDEEENLLYMRSLASRPDPNAVFMGTLDDGDLDLFEGAGPAVVPPTAAVTAPPADGIAELAFLYNAEAVASIGGSSDEGVNAPEVVARCNGLIRKCNTMDGVLAIVREMRAAGIVPVDSTYLAVMLVCRNTPVGPARAIEVYDAMRATGVAVSKRSYDLALECALRAKQVRDALRLKDDMQSAGIPISVYTYASLLKCLADNDLGKRRGAKHRLIRTCKLFEEMLACGLTPPPAAFNALIVAAQRARQPDLVARTFEEMVATGVTPSRETYETALSAVSGGGLVDVALDIFAAMRTDGFEPRKTTYNSLLEACASAPQPRVEQAFEIFYRMMEDGRIVPNKRTFALLIDAAVRAGLPSFAFDAFDAMRDIGMEVTLSTYNRLIHAAGLKQNGVKEALGIFEEIKSRADVVPDEYTYGSLLAACARAGDAKTAEALVAEMDAVGVPHNRVTRHAYIASLGRTDKWREALAQYQILRSEGAKAGKQNGGDKAAGPTRETYSLMFDALLSVGGAEAAIAAVALDVGGGESFIHGERASVARAVFRDGIAAEVYEEPINGLDTGDDVSVDLDVAAGGGEPLSISFMSMTRAEAIVATLVLLESLARRGTSEGERVALPSALFIGAGPGTKGNAQRRMLAVESVLRAASLPCETVEDPRTYIIGVTHANLRDWIEEHKGSFTTVDLATPVTVPVSV